MIKLYSASACLGLLTAAALCLPQSSAAAKLEDVVRAFEKNKDYVQPIATIFGSTTNSGWYQSSAVPATFSFYVGLPLNLSLIADADRSFKGTWTDNGCKQYHKNNPTGTQTCKETTSYTAPTLFGSGKGPVLDSSAYSPTTNSIAGTFHVPQNDGNANAASFNWFPFGEPQIGFSYYNTELKLRYFTLPLDVVSVSLPGIGIQHDLSSFLPPLPVSLSVAANWTWLSGEWKPGGKVDGKVTLNGTSAFYGVLGGYTYSRWLEVFLETGWETASLKTGGDLVIHNDSGDELVRPGLTLEGRNGFRASLNIAFHFGYDAVLGQNLGANFGNQVGVLAYRYKK
ncbi:MAG: hypothetical protein JWO30_3422 [Fibrobacteres bacterium]|nr:hypothetical protein [Fibrobacterota bacterium]